MVKSAALYQEGKMEEENRVKKMLEGLTPEERKAKLDCGVQIYPVNW
jgi:hypothetical protein